MCRLSLGQDLLVLAPRRSNSDPWQITQPKYLEDFGFEVLPLSLNKKDSGFIDFQPLKL
jgi:hypothetical protein